MGLWGETSPDLLLRPVHSVPLLRSLCTHLFPSLPAPMEIRLSGRVRSSERPCLASHEEELLPLGGAGGPTATSQLVPPPGSVSAPCVVLLPPPERKGPEDNSLSHRASAVPLSLQCAWLTVGVWVPSAFPEEPRASHLCEMVSSLPRAAPSGTPCGRCPCPAGR